MTCRAALLLLCPVSLLEILPKGNEAAVVTVLSTLNMPKAAKSVCATAEDNRRGRCVCRSIREIFWTNALAERWESEKGQSSSPSIDLT
jgi:hypothetical protein